MALALRDLFSDATWEGTIGWGAALAVALATFAVQARQVGPVGWAF